MSQKPASESLKDALTDLIAARDQARLRLHLLSLDAQSKWRDLESKVESFEKNMENEAERLTDVSAGKARDLAKAVRKFVEQNL